jgi:hypothetical protein
MRMIFFKIQILIWIPYKLKYRLINNKIKNKKKFLSKNFKNQQLNQDISPKDRKEFFKIYR